MHKTLAQLPQQMPAIRDLNSCATSGYVLPTTILGTEELPRLKQDHNPQTHPWQVVQPALVTVMHSARSRSTYRASKKEQQVRSCIWIAPSCRRRQTKKPPRCSGSGILASSTGAEVNLAMLDGQSLLRRLSQQCRPR